MDEKGEPNKSEQPKRNPKPKKPKTLFMPLMIAGAVLITIILISGLAEPEEPEQRSLQELIEDIKEGKVEKLILKDYTAQVILRPGKPGKKSLDRYNFTFPRGYLSIDAFDRIAKAGGKNAPEIITEPPQSMFSQVFWGWLPYLALLLLIYFFLFRSIRGAGMGGGVLSFGKSRGFQVDPSKQLITFKDVAGIDEAKEEVQEIIEFLKNPGKFQRLGGRIPRGVMLIGAPGTGKTLLAKAIAGEAGVPFFSISGSDFVEMFVGVGASRVRDLFSQAKEQSPCIIFLDEIDAVGRKRGTGLGGGHDEREQTLNAILVEMDGFTREEGIILIAATNRPDILDPALLRPGRFDREIVIDLPDFKGREAILEVHSRKIKLAESVDLLVIARGTSSFSGADLEALMNESAIHATMAGKDAVDMDDIEESRDKVRWGRQKKSRVMDEEDRRHVAFHEAGHALVASLQPHVEPLHKVTIIPRGMALGATMILPEKDRYTYSEKQAIGDMSVKFGGYAAEEIFFSMRSSGAKNDIEMATVLARLMVTEWGMSDKVGPINYSESHEHEFLGRDLLRSPKSYSEATSVLIDSEIKRIITNGLETARKMILDNRDALENIARGLLKYESLNGKEVSEIIKGKDINELRPENNVGNSLLAIAKKSDDVEPDDNGNDKENKEIDKEEDKKEEEKSDSGEKDKTPEDAGDKSE